jgi:tetratricopeptide (TPR) repeat protein
MKQFFKKISFISLVLIIAVYFFGCTSAELTTGKLAYQQKDFEKAEKELSKGLLIDKTDDEGWYMLGYSQIEIGKFDDAKNSFKTALSISNKWSDYIKNYWIDKYNAGIETFNSGLKSVQRKDTVVANNKFTKALDFFKAAISIIPDSVNSYQMMGDCYTYLGQQDKALGIYEGILNKSKSKEDAIMIAKILYQSGMKARESEQWDKALEVFKKVMTIKFLPEDNTYYENSIFNVGFANYQIASKIAAENKGEYKPYLTEAVNVLEPLVKKTKDKALLSNTYEILINAYDALGMNDKKEEAVKKKQELK